MAASTASTTPKIRALQADPTLTDLAWLGDRAALHLCDSDTILEIDPTRLNELDLPLLGKFSSTQQLMVAAIIQANSLGESATIRPGDGYRLDRWLGNFGVD